MSHDNRDEVEVGDVDWSHRQHTRHQGAGIQTGGIFDDVGDALGGAYDSVAGAADWAAGSTDEAVARTFDDEEGGGILHGFQEFMPFMSQPDSVTQRQIEQGVIDDPDGQGSTTDQTQQNREQRRDFDRTGTPTTDGQDNNDQQNNDDSGMDSEQMKTYAMIGGAVLGGGFLLTKVGGSDSERSVPSTGRTTRREVGNGARSNRGDSSQERNRGSNGGV